MGVTVRPERRWTSAGELPPGNWFAPPGSNRTAVHGLYRRGLYFLDAKPSADCGFWLQQ